MVTCLSQLVLILTCFSYIKATENDCHSVYVRLPRAALDQTARVSGPYDLKECQEACSKDKHPANAKFKFECAAFNHRKGYNAFSNDCQLYTKDQLADLDHDLVARDQYSFYKKYCVPSKKICKSVFEYELVMDSYMERSEVETTVPTKNVEECLATCLDEKKFTCRSVSYNRTGNTCLLSTHNRISKPGYVRVNSLPDFRIDYYENNCYNDSFTFSTECKSDGILVSVEAQFDYDGAIYGLYDYFTCRYEPKKERKFSFFFPLPKLSKNCSASMYYQDGDIIADVILSTDGVEPLYFTTDQDVLYHARCKAPQTETENKISATVATNIDIDPVKYTKQSETEHQRNLEKTTITPVWWLFSGSTNSSSASNSSANFTSSTESAILTTTTTFGPSFVLATLFSNANQTGSKWNVSSNATVPNLRNFTNSSAQANVTSTTEPITTFSSQTPYTDTIVGSTVKQGGPYKTVLIGNIFGSHTDISNNLDPVPLDSHLSATKPHETDIHSTTVPTTLATSISSVFSTVNYTQNYTVVNTTVKVVKNNEISNFTSLRSPTTTETISTASTKASEFWWKNQDRTTTTEKPWWRQPETTPNATTSVVPTTTTTTTTTTTFDLTTSNTTQSSSSRTSSQSTPPTTQSSTATSSTTASSTALAVTNASAFPNISKSFYTTTAVPQDIKFEVLYNGVPTQAVLIQSLITLSFSPGSTINADPSQLALLSCKVEAVGSRYFLEPLVLVEKGCPSDGVGLVYPVRKSKNGLAVEMESFRFTDSSEVLYTCVVRVCEGQCASFPCFDAGGNPYVSFGRKKRQLNVGISSKDYTVQKKLVVFNNQYDFQYYLRTGRVPLTQQPDDNRFGG